MIGLKSEAVDVTSRLFAPRGKSGSWGFPFAYGTVLMMGFIVLVCLSLAFHSISACAFPPLPEVLESLALFWIPLTGNRSLDGRVLGGPVGGWKLRHFLQHRLDTEPWEKVLSPPDFFLKTNILINYLNNMF